MKPFNNEDSKRLELVTRLYHEEAPLDILQDLLDKIIKEKRKREFREKILEEAMKE